VAPGIKRAGLMYNPTTATYFEYYLKPFAAAAEAAGVKSTLLTVRNIAAIHQAFATRNRDDGIVLMSDPFLTVNRAFTNGAAVSYPRCFRGLAKRLSHNLCAGYPRPLSTLGILC
jgi:hypothetical protein